VSDAALVGLDLGTSGCKGVVVAEDGRLLATAQDRYPTVRSREGRAEQSPADWEASVTRVVRALGREVPPGRWNGIGLSAMIPTLVTADGSAQPVGPAITWEDDRARGEGRAFRDEVGGDALYRATGQWVDGRYLLPMFRWLASNEPERASRTRWILSAKDHLFRTLTGECATDPSTASGFGCYGLAEGAWIPELAGEVLARLPQVRPPTWSAPLTGEAAARLGVAAGLPVSLGAADSVAGALGLGAVAPGDSASLWGTSTVILGVSADLSFDEAHRYLVTPLAIGPGWGLEMDLLSTGSAIAWIAAWLGLDGEASVFDLAARSPMGANGLTFLPFVGFGEQGALWDPDLRGTLHGATLLHGREDVARALLEGIAREFRRCVDVLQEVGVSSREIAVAGGASGASMFSALLADAAQVTIVRPEVAPWASATGAARIVGTTAGAPAHGISGPAGGARSEPDPSAEPGWVEISARHDELLAALRTLGPTTA
jgi:xylulokinase